jgi:hypothetical protein
LPATGDNPGSDAVNTTLAGMMFQLSNGNRFDANSYIGSIGCTRPFRCAA